MFDSDRISISWFYVSTSVINWSISNDIVRHRHMHMWHVQCMCTLYALSLTLLHFVHNLFSKEVKEPWQNAKLNNVLCTLKLDRINVLKKNKNKKVRLNNESNWQGNATFCALKNVTYWWRSAILAKNVLDRMLVHQRVLIRDHFRWRMILWGLVGLQSWCCYWNFRGCALTVLQRSWNLINYETELNNILRFPRSTTKKPRITNNCFP